MVEGGTIRDYLPLKTKDILRRPKKRSKALETITGLKVRNMDENSKGNLSYKDSLFLKVGVEMENELKGFNFDVSWLFQKEKNNLDQSIMEDDDRKNQITNDEYMAWYLPWNESLTIKVLVG
ncbi:hypothetical protein RJT34_00849 [Clitoria ternatea]|uniref:Uncharacterized protein n=1 Tax=Clitoria ternatea TaxID=43366 RepID=A0AAN9PY93_CLITE